MRAAFFGAIFAAGLVGSAAAQSVAVVRADNQPLWGDPAPLRRELRLGVLDGPEEQSFGRIVGITISRDGQIWIADAQASIIRRFDANGKYLGSVGRNGEGPGEFRNLAGLQQTPDGRIAAWDSRLKRVSFFDDAGEYIEAVLVPAQYEVGSPHEPFRVGARGELYVLGATVTPPDPAFHLFYLRLRGTEAPDTVRIPAPDPRGPVRGVRFHLLGGMYPFSIVTYSALSPAGHLVTGRNDQYALHTRTDDARALRIERSYDPVRVQAAERREVERLADHFRRRNPSTLETSTAIPRHKPPFWNLWVDQDNRIWVARHGRGFRIPETAAERERRKRFDNPPSEWWDPLAFDVIDRRGRFLGSIRFANVQAKPMFAEGQRVWVLEQGEYGEQYVVRYLIGSSTR